MAADKRPLGGEKTNQRIADNQHTQQDKQRNPKNLHQCAKIGIDFVHAGKHQRGHTEVHHHTGNEFSIVMQLRPRPGVADTRANDDRGDNGENICHHKLMPPDNGLFKGLVKASKGVM